MNLLQIVKEFCRRTAIPVPNSVVSNPDPQIQQILGLANEGLEDFNIRHLWQSNQFEASFTCTGQESQGLLSNIAPNFRKMLPGTFFDRAKNLRLSVISSADWQAQKSLGTGPFYQWRIRGDNLLFTPAPAAGLVITFEYYSDALVRNGLRPGGSTTFLKDDDYISFPDALLLSYLRWRWKAEKRLDYSEEFRQYELTVSTLANNDGEPGTIDASGCSNRGPGVFIPIGNWMR